VTDRPRPLWRSPYVVLACAVLFAAGAVAAGSTLASFSAETDNNTSTFPGGWIGAASGLAASASGTDGSLTWTPGTHGPVTGQQLYALDNGSSSSCPANGYTLNHTMAAASTASYTATNATTTTLSDKLGVNTLSQAMTNVQTTLHVTATTSFPSTNGYTVQVDSEQMTVTANAGTTIWTVTRGVNGTTAVAHSNAAAVRQVSLTVASASAFPGAGSYGIQVDGEQMTVTSGQGTTSWLVTRAAGSTTANAHASGAVVAQTTDPVSGHYYCYEMTSTSATSWTTTTSPVALQMGLVMTGVVVTNSGTANALTTSDTVKITFNQQQSTIVNVSSNTAIVCEIWDGATPSNMTVYFDHVAYGAAGTTNPCATGVTPNYDVALSGLTITHAVAGAATVNAQDVVAASGPPWDVTWTLKANGKALAAQTTITGTTSQQVDSTNGGTDVGAACISVTYNCTQVATGTKF
jgi:hypothetical protein